MDALQQFIEKHNCEEVGGRLIAVVNGKKEYVADIGNNRSFALTFHGEVLEAQAPAAVEEKPKRKPKKDAADSDLLAGLDDQ